MLVICRSARAPRGRDSTPQASAEQGDVDECVLPDTPPSAADIPRTVGASEQREAAIAVYLTRRLRSLALLGSSCRKNGGLGSILGRRRFIKRQKNKRVIQ
jgi:hypothetical protein